MSESINGFEISDWEEIKREKLQYTFQILPPSIGFGKISTYVRVTSTRIIRCGRNEIQEYKDEIVIDESLDQRYLTKSENALFHTICQAIIYFIERFMKNGK